MTYQRNETLISTVRVLLQQTYPPEKILIVDNDPNGGAKAVLDLYPSENVCYHRMGFNAGPAGAAKAGLELLASEGYKWIGWLDDDDPPIFENAYEQLIDMAENYPNCGCVGAVGQRYNIHKGLIDRVRDAELEEIGAIEVDNIAGGMSKVVSGNAVREKNVWPDATLFFGFEELDFDLRLQKAGFVLLADRSFYKKHRAYYNRIGLQIQRGKEKPLHKLWREYYSTRNSLYIMHKHRSIRGKLYILLRSLAKCLAGFRYGFTYGSKQAKIILLALLHYFAGKKGQVTFSSITP